jgi:polyisoprenoid-binding protein YceI
MKQLTIVLALAWSSIALHAQLPATAMQYSINMPESRVEFYVSSTVGDVNGTFKSWKGELKVATPGVAESASMDLQISAASMTTGSGAKDKVVKGEDFFYVAKYPEITFTSTKVIPSNNPNQFQVQGEFTLRGITKPVTLQVTLDRDGKGGGQIYGDLSFDRRDFGMTRNMMFVRVGDSVRVRLDIDVIAKPIAVAAKP